MYQITLIPCQSQNIPNAGSWPCMQRIRSPTKLHCKIKGCFNTENRRLAKNSRRVENPYTLYLGLILKITLIENIDSHYQAARLTKNNFILLPITMI
jgi:hypothetical protein